MINEINHEVFGNLRYNYGWVKEQEIHFWSKNRTIQIIIDGEDAEFQNNHIEAYKSFFADMDIFIYKAEEAVFNYYQKVFIDYRERLRNDLRDKIVPVIELKQDIIELVTPNQILFPLVFDKDIREVGILLDCTWEKEHGLAVKFQNEEVVDVGYLDIIL